MYTVVKQFRFEAWHQLPSHDGTIGQCYKQAREQRHEFMTVEHLLLALLENPSATQVLRACSACIGLPVVAAGARSGSPTTSIGW